MTGVFAEINNKYCSNRYFKMDDDIASVHDSSWDIQEHVQCFLTVLLVDLSVHKYTAVVGSVASRQCTLQLSHDPSLYGSPHVQELMSARKLLISNTCSGDRRGLLMRQKYLCRT